jgi:hypothetical protein
MRAAVASLLLVLLLAACGSTEKSSQPPPRIFTSTGQSSEAIAGQRAGGPPSLTVDGDEVVGKALLVLRVRPGELVVRNPDGGTLTLEHARQDGSQAIATPGEHASFRGIRTGTTVRTSTLAVLQSR